MKSYFTLEELCHSDLAEKLGIDNTPGPKEEFKLLELIDFLNPIREAWGSQITVTSGFRCKELNDVLGGSTTSAHLTGNAVDLFPRNCKLEDFKRFILGYLQDKNYDQVIVERNGRSQWIHFGIRDNKGRQRKMNFSITK